MKMTLEFRPVPRARGVGVSVIVATLAVLMAAPVAAFELAATDNYTLNLDTTLSWGARYRIADRDEAIIGVPSGGTAWSVNGDDGDLNFDKGIVSNTLKATIDLGYEYKGWSQTGFGFFVRGSGFHDFALENDCCARTELTEEALDWAGQRVELLDAYAWFQFGVGSGQAEIRVGNQVLNWGESTFIQGGLSGINPVDVSALRVPGAELREAFRPLGMVWASVDLSENFSLEGFYEYEWEPIVIDPPGTYFSTNDFAGLGGETVFLGFGSFPDTGVSPPYIQPPVDYPYMGVPRGATVDAEDGGQYGIALRLFMPNWNGTEFGFYYTNLHSRLPTINGVSGTIQGAQAAAAAGPAAALQFYYLMGVPPGVSPEIDALALQVAQGAGTAAYADTATWYTAYPEDIKLYGLSWNAQLGTTGIAFQGEATYKQDAPYQVDDVELLFAALSPISEGLALTNQVVPGGVGFSENIDGYRRLDSSQLQFTLTKIAAQILGADQAVFLGEFGFNWIFDMPSKDELRFDGPGTYTSGNPIHELPGGAHAGKPYELPEHFADDFSWGYRLVARFQYNNAIGPWSLVPTVAWAQDVSGITPGPGGAFLEGAKALTVSLSSDYQNAWQVELSYTMYSGASRYNLINDRDFIGGFIKYSF
jgi:hypothetical protein